MEENRVGRGSQACVVFEASKETADLKVIAEILVTKVQQVKRGAQDKMVDPVLTEHKDQLEFGGHRESLVMLDQLDLKVLRALQELKELQVSQVNREILAVMEPLGPREKGATRALLVHEDSQVLLVLKVQKEKKEPQETRDDLGLMDERATRVMQVLLEQWVPREMLEKMEHQEILVSLGHQDAQEMGEPQDEQENEAQMVKRERLGTEGMWEHLEVVECKEGGVSREKKALEEKSENQVHRAPKGIGDFAVLEEDLVKREPKVPRVLTGYQV